MMVQSVTFGTLLRRYRIAAGLTQEELAERAGISRRSLSDMERGVAHTPRKDTVALLAGALDLSPPDRSAFAEAAQRLRAEAMPVPAPSVMRVPPFVGRARELGLLERHLAGEGPPLLLLAGEPGIGKTRLLHAALPRAATRGLRVLDGGCQRRGGQEPFAPLLGALQRQIRGRRPDALRADLQGCAWLVRLLPELAGGPIPHLPPWTPTPEQERRLMSEAVVRFLTNVAGVAGTLLVLDDLQWAGPDALDLLATLARSAAEVPLRLIGAYRDTEVQPRDALSVMLADLAHAGLATRRLLGPLSAQHAEQLLDEVWAGSAGQPSTLREQVLQRAGGVPFFLMSCVQALQQDDHEDPRAAAVPWNVAQSVQQRIAALPDVARDVLGVAAVIGRTAPHGLLRTVAARPEQEVLPALEAACHAHLLEEASETAYRFTHDVIREVVEADPGAARRAVIGRTAPHGLLRTVAARPEQEVLAALEAACHAHLLEEEGETAYRFTHDVIREVVEADLGAARRAVLHRLVAQALEARQGAPPVEQLAYHYARGDQPHIAIPYLERAAEQARETAAYQEEVALLAQAIELARQVGRDDLLGDLHARRGKALFHLTLMAEARQEMQAALASLPPPQEERQAEILIDMALTSYWHSDAAGTRRYGSEALALAERLGREDLAIAAQGALVHADSSDGQHQVGLDRYRQVAAQAGARFPAAVAPGIMMASAMFYWLADFDTAIRCAREAIAFSQAAHDTATLVQAQGNLGCALMGSGRYAEALQAFGEAQRQCTEQRAIRWLARTTAMRGGLHLDLCDFAVAETLAEEARETSRSVGWLNALASAGIDLLLNFTRRGEIGRAEGLLTEVAEQVAHGQGTHGWLWRLRFVQAQAELAQARGEHELALRWADEAIARSRKHGRVKYEVAGLQVRAQALASLGRQREATADLQSAVGQARGTGDPAMFVRAAAILLPIGGTDALLAEARAAVERIAGALPDAEPRRRFQEAEPARAIARLVRT